MVTNSSSARILIVGGTESGKASSLFNLMTHQPDVAKMYLYANDPYKAKYQLLIKKRKSTGLKHLKDATAFIEYSNETNDIYQNIEECNPKKNTKYWFYLMIWLLMCLVIKKT